MNETGLPVAVVFGASGGIGRALVHALAASHRFAAIHAGGRHMPADLPAGTHGFAFDLADEAGIAAAVADIEGEIGLAIVASGVLSDPGEGIAPEKTWRAIDPVAMARVFAVNAIGPALVAKHVLPRLARGRRSVFAVLSARVGSIGDNRLGGWHSYRASKAALNMLVANFAIELRHRRPEAIAVALHPGTVATGLSAPFQAGVPADRLFPAAVSAGHLLAVIDRLGPEDSGGFFAWDGTRLPW